MFKQSLKTKYTSSLVLNKTLKGNYGVRFDNRKVFRAPGPRTIYFKRLLFFVP